MPAEVVWAVPGADVLLPCDISAPEGDKVNMVLWFKDATGIPLYRYRNNISSIFKKCTPQLILMHQLKYVSKL